MAPTRQDAQRILANRFYKGISDSFVGSHEYMAMEALYELHEAGEYDTLIIDTPPRATRSTSSRRPTGSPTSSAPSC